VPRVKAYATHSRGWSAPETAVTADDSYRVISGGLGGVSSTRFFPNPDVTRAVAGSQEERAMDVTAPGKARQGSMGTSVKNDRGSGQDALNLQSNERPVALTGFAKPFVRK
jgi:hypothetical protein